jgi:hypothetical protein
MEGYDFREKDNEEKDNEAEVPRGTFQINSKIPPDVKGHYEI